MDTDNLRKWAEWHADHGHHDVAHALYRSAERYDDQILALDRVRAFIDNPANRVSGEVFTDPEAVLVDDLRTVLDGDS
ncbi:hypothetical protein C6Y44_04075 [Rhodococcus rhodochrous]|nr:hypothetical protein C6Y44_04075 [Rhodococcus rhodochrous]